MPLYSCPKILNIDQLHTIVCSGQTTHYSFLVQGVGILIIKTVGDSAWPGYRQVILNEGMYKLHLPINADIKVKFIGFLGIDTKQFSTPNSSSS